MRSDLGGGDLPQLGAAGALEPGACWPSAGRSRAGPPCATSRCRAGRPAWPPAVLVTAPLVVRQLNEPQTDLPALAWLACVGRARHRGRAAPGAARSGGRGRRPGGRHQAVHRAAGRSAVLAVGAYPARDRLRPLAGSLALAVAGAFVVGGIWYAQNLIEHGSPLWPFAVGPLGRPGAALPRARRRDLPPAPPGDASTDTSATTRTGSAGTWLLLAGRAGRARLRAAARGHAAASCAARWSSRAALALAGCSDLVHGVGHRPADVARADLRRTASPSPRCATCCRRSGGRRHGRRGHRAPAPAAGSRSPPGAARGGARLEPRERRRGSAPPGRRRSGCSCSGPPPAWRAGGSSASRPGGRRTARRLRARWRGGRASWPRWPWGPCSPRSATASSSATREVEGSTAYGRRAGEPGSSTNRASTDTTARSAFASRGVIAQLAGDQLQPQARARPADGPPAGRSTAWRAACRSWPPRPCSAGSDRRRVLLRRPLPGTAPPDPGRGPVLRLPVPPVKLGRALDRAARP